MKKNNSFRKRAQASFEFLATYGWAILIILIAIGALSYYGFMNPQNVLPDKCIFGNGLICQDSLITTNTVNISLYNGFGKSIYNVSVAPSGFSVVGCGVTPNISVSGDVPMKIGCRLSAALTKDEKKKLKFVVSYQKVFNGYRQNSYGEVYGSVQ